MKKQSILTYSLESAFNGSYFTSLSALREAHSDLLKLHRERGSQKEVLNKIEHLIYKGRATGSILDNEEDRWSAQSLLDYWSSLLYRAEQEAPDTTLVDFDLSLAPDLSDSLCPYVGLEAFHEEHHHLFFGRQRLTEKLLQHLQKNRLLIVSGSSGSGKSSVVMGGLLPRLKSDSLLKSDDWRYILPFVPGSKPIEALISNIFEISADSSEEIQQHATMMQKHPQYLLNSLGDTPTTIVLDQFEEIFTLCGDNNDRHAFINNLLSLVQEPTNIHRLILTIRSDFESQIARFPELDEIFEASVIRVLAMGAHELRDAIEKPALQIGLKFEAGLIDTLVSDFLGEPAALPLLQFTLLKLWEMREHNRITHKSYKDLGRGRQALSTSADRFFKNLIPEDQVTAKRILLRMIRPTQGLEVTSNRILKQDLYQTGEASDRVDRVLNKLIEARLIRQTPGQTSDDDQIEVAHEALVRNWDLLVSWLEDERGKLRQRLQVRSLAEQWQIQGRSRSILLQGTLLNDAQQYEDLSALEEDFVQCSRKRKRWITNVFGILTFAILVMLLTIIGGLAWRAKNETTQTIEELKRENNNLQRTIDNRNQAIKTMQGQNQNLEQEKTELRKTNINLERKNDSLQSQIDSFSQTIQQENAPLEALPLTTPSGSPQQPNPEIPGDDPAPPPPSELHRPPTPIIPPNPPSRPTTPELPPRRSTAPSENSPRSNQGARHAPNLEQEHQNRENRES